MNKQDNLEPNNRQPMIEDLAVNQDQAEEVKGGYIVKLRDVLVSGYQSGDASGGDSIE